MEIILTQDVERLGSKDDLVKVKDGFAQNYLIPQKKAIAATVTAKKILAEAINKKGFEIDRKQILMPEDHIKEVGTYTAKIKLHKEVIIEVEFEVVAE